MVLTWYTDSATDSTGVPSATSSFTRITPRISPFVHRTTLSLARGALTAGDVTAKSVRLVAQLRDKQSSSLSLLPALTSTSRRHTSIVVWVGQPDAFSVQIPLMLLAGLHMPLKIIATSFACHGPGSNTVISPPLYKHALSLTKSRSYSAAAAHAGTSLSH